jgi:hypothetical protein
MAEGALRRIHGPANLSGELHVERPFRVERVFDRPLLTSGLIPETDIQLIRWHVSNGPRVIMHQATWTYSIAALVRATSDADKRA